ncbi:MAG: hypothetical protein EOO59_19570 [Hymenobacter sp.]|nr:MAG: hypothetical protein EOO59_19570 [Hymenobacter sp.]
MRWALCLAPAGLAAYMVFLWGRFDDPLAFLHLQSVWGRGLHAPWRSWLAHGAVLDHLSMWGACLMCLGPLRRQAPWRDTVWVGLSLLVPMLSGRVVSLARFVGVLFVLFVSFPYGSRPLRRAYFALSLVGSLVMAFKVGQGGKVI